MTRLYCEHANEKPRVCPCDAECYCKENTCRSRARRVERNMSTPEMRAFWKSAEESSREVAKWPCWKRGVQCPGNCCACRPLSSAIQVLCLNLAQAGYCAHHAPLRERSRWSMLEVD